MERQPSGFAPSFAPRPYGRRTSGWGQVIKHGPEPTLYVIDLASNPALISQYVRSHVARDKPELSPAVRHLTNGYTGRAFSCTMGWWSG